MAVMTKTVIAIGLMMAQVSGYAGRDLADVLRDFQRHGLNIVFSSELVKPEMKVADEPRATTPRKILDEVLAPHGLAVRSGPRGSLIVIRAKPPLPPRRRGPLVRSGRVVDARTGEPLPGVLVLLVGASREEVTGADGTFTLTGMSPARLRCPCRSSATACRGGKSRSVRMRRPGWRCHSRTARRPIPTA